MSSIASLILQSKGLQDTYLQSGAIQENPLIYVYKRQANIVSQFIELAFQENCEYGRQLSCILPKRGDFLHKCFLMFHIDPLVRVDGSYAAYTNSLGHAIIEHVDFYIDNVLIDRHYSEYLEIWSELTTRTKDSDGLKLMLGKTDVPQSLSLFYADAHDLYVPLQFFFCREISMALPLAKLPFQQFKISIKIRKLEDVMTFDGLQQPLQTGPLKCALLAQYLFVNKDVQETALRHNKQVIIEQVQRRVIQYPTIQKTLVTRLDFNHPVKALYWVLIEQNSMDNNDYFHFGNRAVEFTSAASRFRLTLDDSEVIDQNETFYRLIVPSIVHTNITNKHIYMYSFCSDNVEANNATGTINLSNSRALQLHSTLKSGLESELINLHVFAVNFNVIQYHKGLVKILFSS